MEKVQVRFPEDDLKKLRREVDEGKYPTMSEAIRDKVRKSFLLEAIVHMREATEEMDLDEALTDLEATREEQYAEFKESSR